MRKPKPASVAMRLSPALKEKIERYRSKLAKDSPGIGVTMSDALRHLVETALAEQKL